MHTTNKPYYTNAGILDKFMKYLHDNGFKVLTLKQIGGLITITSKGREFTKQYSQLINLVEGAGL